MSTISTQMNWGASYLVNDVYKRFVAPTADDARLVRMSRLVSGGVLVLGGVASWLMVLFRVTPDEAWGYLAALGGGLGTVFMLRWFWWRVNAWSEITAMAGSVLVFLAVLGWQQSLPEAERMAGEYTSLLVASLTLVLWLVVTFVTPAEPRQHLIAFFRKIRPDGPGWGPIAAAAPDARPDGDLGRNLLCALLGTTVIWLTLPGIGGLIFGDYGRAALCLGGATAAGAVLLWLVGRSAASAPARG